MFTLHLMALPAALRLRRHHKSYHVSTATSSVAVMFPPPSLFPTFSLQLPGPPSSMQWSCQQLHLLSSLLSLFLDCCQLARSLFRVVDVKERKEHGMFPPFPPLIRNLSGGDRIKFSSADQFCIFTRILAAQTAHLSKLELISWTTTSIGR